MSPGVLQAIMRLLPSEEVLSYLAMTKVHGVTARSVTISSTLLRGVSREKNDTILF